MFTRDDLCLALNKAFTSHTLTETTHPIYTMNTSPYINAYNILNEKQKSVFRECLEKNNGGISLPMGEGKTLLSIVLGLQIRENLKSKIPFLAIMKKTLIGGWETEIEKFFGKKLRVLVLHSSYIKDLTTTTINLENYDIILTTINVVTKYYKLGQIEPLFVEKVIENEGMFNQHIINLYNTPHTPLLGITNSGFILYSTKWSCVIVDEVQLYTNIETDYCRSLGSLCAHHRWVLSGTMFDEPKITKILGYFVIIGDEYFPRTLPMASLAIRSSDFTGYSRTLVERNKSNLTYTLPPIREETICHNLSKEEEKLYMSIRGIMQKLQVEHNKHKQQRNVAQMREFGSYIMATIIYLKQLVVCSLIPVAKAAIDSADLASKSKLSVIMNKSFEELGLKAWLDNEASIYSSRFKEVLKVINSHPKARIVIFSCYRTVLDLLMYCEQSGRPKFTINASESIKKRKETMIEFAKSDNGAFYLSYDIGAEGLNLQAGSVVIMMDHWWNDGKSTQAMSRVARQGQINPEVFVYFFTSNTQMENVIFQKHSDKLSILHDLREGSTQKKVKTLNVNEIVRIVTTNEVYTSMKAVREIKGV